LVRAWRILGVVLVISTYFVQAPFAYGVFALLGAFPTRDPIARARRLQFIMMCGFRGMHAVLRWLRILDFDPRQVQGEIPSFPCVLVANHPTLTDISAVLATERNIVFPVKPDLFRSFWARPLLAQSHQFEGAGPGAFTVGHVIDSAVERIARGYRVIIFPEGTRSPETGLHPFGRTAFEVAVRAGVPVVPIVITCTPRWLSKNRGFLDPPAELPKLRLRALPAVQLEQARSSSRTLRDIVFQQICSELERADCCE
jgi:1-acyl-sn-glycerol-3-phosphate acyltransferase